jgi:putative ABC transport system permease protein
MEYNNKYFNFFAVAAKNITSNRSQSFFIAAPLSFIIAIVSAITFYMEGVEHDALLAANSLPDILLQQQVGGRTESLLFDRYEDILKKIAGVDQIIPRIWGYISYEDKHDNSKAFVLMGMAPQFVNSGKVFKTVVEKGRTLSDNDIDKALVGNAVAEAFGASVGDIIEVSSPDMRRKYPLEIIGTFDSEVQIYTADLLLVPLDTGRKIFGFYEESEYSDILLYLNDPSRADTIAQEISSQIEGARPITKRAMYRLTELSFNQRSGNFQLLWLVLLLNILIISWSAMSNLSHNQKQQIGILKAIGWSTEDIMLLKILEMGMVSFTAVLAGILAGLLYMLADAPGLKKMLIGWSDIYPDFPIPLYVEWQTVFFLMVLGVLPIMATILVPIWKSSLIEPVKMIRSGD